MSAAHADVNADPESRPRDKKGQARCTLGDTVNHGLLWIAEGALIERRLG